MALNEKNYELINEFMEQVCRLTSLNSPRLFMDALKGFTRDKGIGGDGWWVTTEFIEAATMTESDIEYLGGRKFDGVVFDEALNMSEPPTTLLSYQEFYAIIGTGKNKRQKQKRSLSESWTNFIIRKQTAT